MATLPSGTEPTYSLLTPQAMATATGQRTPRKKSQERHSKKASQPELGADRVSLRPPICPKGGPIDLLGIPGPNSAQKSGGKGWNPANGVPFCARAYICRPRPLGLAGWLCDAGEYLGRP